MQSGVRWLLDGRSVGSVEVTLVVSEVACAGLGLIAWQSEPIGAKQAVAMAVVCVCAAGVGVQSGVLVRARWAEF